MELEYQTVVNGSKGLIDVQGDLDDDLAGEALRRAFNRLFETGVRTVVLDLRKVQCINSHGIGKILSFHKRLQAEGGTLMVKPLLGPIKETFELLMLDCIFPVDAEEQERAR
jgi:anti-anti-sigma factor